MFPLPHYKSSLPKWRFWARMKRPLLDQTEQSVAVFKKSFIQTVTLLSPNGDVLVKPKLQLGVKAELYKDDKLMGSVKNLRIKPKKLFPGTTMCWGIEKDGDEYIFLWPVDAHKLADEAGKHNVSVGRANETYQIVKGEKVIGELICATGGLFENFDLIFEGTVSEEDRLLCIMLMGYKVHALLK